MNALPNGSWVNRRAAWVASAALSLLFLLVYGGCNWVTAHRSDVGLWYYSWERFLPFVPLLVVPYMSIDLFFVCAPFLCRERAELRVLVQRIIFAILVAALFFLLVPLHMAGARPASSGWTAGIFLFLHGFDQPFNLFPSLHAALLLILAPVYLPRVHGWWRGLCGVWFGLIGVSILLTGQHHVADVGGGVVLGVVAFYLFEMETRSPSPWPRCVPNAATSWVPQDRDRFAERGPSGEGDYVAAVKRFARPGVLAACGFSPTLETGKAVARPFDPEYTSLKRGANGRTSHREAADPDVCARGLLASQSAANSHLAFYYAGGAAACVTLGCLTAGWSLVLFWPGLSFALTAAGYAGVGPHVYRKADGTIPWYVSLLLAPSLAGQWLSWAWYRRRSAPWDWITPEVCIGRRPTSMEADQAIAQGVTAVLDLTAEFPIAKPFDGLRYLNLPVLDLTAPTSVQLELAVAFIESEVAEGGRVYVHCKAGYSRSAAVVGAWVLATGRAFSVEEVVRLLKERRPGMVVRPEVELALDQWMHPEPAPECGRLGRSKVGRSTERWAISIP